MGRVLSSRAVISVQKLRRPCRLRGCLGFSLFWPSAISDDNPTRNEHSGNEHELIFLASHVKSQ